MVLFSRAAQLLGAARVLVSLKFITVTMSVASSVLRRARERPW
jgi:hypothetical protein